MLADSRKSALGAILIPAALFIGLSVLPTWVQAGFVTLGGGVGSKWGDPVHGTPSDVITWTFMNDGTGLHPSHPLFSEVVGTSNITTLRTAIDMSYGTGAFTQSIQRAFDTWASAAPGRITFQFVPTDTGALGGDQSNPAASATDIRISAFNPVANSGFSFLGAVGYGPPGNDLFFPDALAGDIIFNLSAPFFIAPGQEDDIFYTGGVYQNDLEGLMLHELGHAAIGLGHPSNGIGDVMYVDNFPACCSFINRQLSPDDIAGARSVYGVPEPVSWSGLLCGAAIALAIRRRVERLS